ncbi:MAG: hypothetical protein OEU26_07620 [Candidatus Tectomicrobia bacterium]|nr:hypothetical protein [Candidatus Tectomicrobia bacterium]
MRFDERTEPDDEAPFRGTRRHRGALCRKCFFYRQVSDEDEACEAYGKWLVFPQVKRVNCDQYISR